MGARPAVELHHLVPGAHEPGHPRHRWQVAHGDGFHNDRFPDLKADYILANPPFNVSDWRGNLLMMDQRWQFGVPPAGNNNFAWV
jgi:type I restriction-modification system DNA methylase subunit